MNRSRKPSIGRRAARERSVPIPILTGCSIQNNISRDFSSIFFGGEGIDAGKVEGTKKSLVPF